MDATVKCPVSASVEEQEAARLRFKQAREAAGKDLWDIAHIVDGYSACWDLETCDGDLFMVIGLGELAQICAMFGIKAQNLFLDVPSNEP